MKQALLLISLLLALTGSSAQPAAGEDSAPQRIRLRSGESVILTARAGTDQVFQWYRDGVAIPGATDKNYRTAVAGSYAVISTSATCISVFSDPVEVLVLPPDAFSADVSVVKATPGQAASLGEPVEYTISVRNNGPDEATSVTVTDSLPAELGFDGVSEAPARGNFSYNTMDRTFTWNIPGLVRDSTLSLKIRTLALAAGQIRNRAFISAFEADPDRSNNQSAATREVLGLRVPNVFSPNGDALNERFRIPGLALYDENEFTVINRWGHHVFERKQYRDEWTGEGLNEGTYFYVLRVRSGSGSWQVMKGYITLLRLK